MEKRIKKQSYGKECFRLRKFLGKSVQDVSRETNVSVSTVYAFEEGFSDNFALLCWYRRHGLSNDVLKEDICCYE